MDFLEHSAIEDVIIMSVVIEEVRHKNASAYQRLRTLTAASDRRFFVFSNEHHRYGLPNHHAADILVWNSASCIDLGKLCMQRHANGL